MKILKKRIYEVIVPSGYEPSKVRTIPSKEYDNPTLELGAKKIYGWLQTNITAKTYDSLCLLMEKDVVETRRRYGTR